MKRTTSKPQIKRFIFIFLTEPPQYIQQPQLQYRPSQGIQYAPQQSQYVQQQPIQSVSQYGQQSTQGKYVVRTQYETEQIQQIPNQRIVDEQVPQGGNNVQYQQVAEGRPQQQIVKP